MIDTGTYPSEVFGQPFYLLFREIPENSVTHSQLLLGQSSLISLTVTQQV